MPFAQRRISPIQTQADLLSLERGSQEGAHLERSGRGFAGTRLRRSCLETGLLKQFLHVSAFQLEVWRRSLPEPREPP
jgi:hypothetical protein